VNVATPTTPPTGEQALALWDRTRAVVRATLDSLGFHRGASLDIRLAGGTVNNDIALFLPVSRKIFSTTQSEDVSRETLARYVLAAAQNENLRHALADVREAMRLTEDSSFYCYRAIESMRQQFLPQGVNDNGADREASWVKLRSVFGADRAQIDQIRLAANPRRHGGAAADADRSVVIEHIRSTRQWVDRFAQHLSATP